jgi:hypothetical protein
MGEYFQAVIETREGSLADKVIIDKQAGSMRSVY